MINNKIKIIIFAFVFLSFFGIPSFQQGESEQGDNIDPWSFDYEFGKELVLMGIPTGIGMFTAKKLTNSWQKRKEKSEISRKILEEYDDAVVRYGFKILTFDRIMWETYSKINNNTKLNENGRIEGITIDFPTNKDELPESKLRKEYMEMAKDIDSIFNSLWRFESSLQFYYKDKELNDKCSQLISSIRPVWFELQKMYFAKTIEEFKNQHNVFGNKYTQIQRGFKEFRDILLSKEISEKNLK